MKENFVADIRAFSRFYTNILGLLKNHILNSKFTLPEVRILFEVYYNPAITAKEITTIVDIDKGQLSRILNKLEKEKLLKRNGSKEDGRAMVLSLTKAGICEFEKLNDASNEQLLSLLQKISNSEAKELITHMKAIQQILSV
jgi:DNA-binding MarR family transcriptional regulator